MMTVTCKTIEKIEFKLLIAKKKNGAAVCGYFLVVMNAFF